MTNIDITIAKLIPYDDEHGVSGSLMRAFSSLGYTTTTTTTFED